MLNKLREIFSPFSVRVALRYLRSKRRTRFLSLITTLSTLGVFVGVTSLIVVISVMDGFKEEMKKKLFVSDVHLAVFEKDAFKPIETSTLNALESMRSEKGVVLVSPIAETEAILKAGKKVAGISLKGVDDARLARIKAKVAESAKSGQAGIWIGQELAYELSILPGDTVSLVSPIETDAALGALPVVKVFNVAGIYHAGLPEQELHDVYADLKVAKTFKPDLTAKRIELTVTSLNEADTLEKKIEKRLAAAGSGAKVKSWKVLNASLFSSLMLERLAMFVILALIVVVASFNIITSLTMMVLEKKREIAIFQAMGANRKQIGSIFFTQGVWIGVVGVGGGALTGLAISIFLATTEFIELPDVYYDRKLPILISPDTYAIVAVCALLIVIVASLVPSLKAAKIRGLSELHGGKST